MLHIYFKREDEYDAILTEDNYRIQPTYWFEFQGGAEYIDGAVERDIIKAIDGGEVLSNGAIKFPIFGLLALECLSGTAKTLILANNEPNVYVNGDFVGDNGFVWLLSLARVKDIYLRAGCIMKYNCDFEAHIINDNSYITTWKDFIAKGVDFLYARNS